MPISVTVDLPPRYRGARHLASGGMATVWAAEDAVLRRSVAVKLLAEQFLGDRRALRRFQREARAAARISHHHHVVTVFDVGVHGGRPFIVMELMQGGSLADVLHRRLPAREEALRWLAEAASALDAAHEAGIVHRDVKPGNLLLDHSGRLGVGDFGIARLVVESTVTLTGQVLGTAAYVAPEQAAGETATAASDRYSLAVVAHELLTGERPGPARHVGDLPGPVAAVLRRGLETDPAARWPTAEGFVSALARACRERTTATAATRPLARRVPDRAAKRFVPGVVSQRPSAATARLYGRHRALAVAALAALVTAGAAALAGSADEQRVIGTVKAKRAASHIAPRSRHSSVSPAGTAPRSRSDSASSSPSLSVAELNDRGFRLMNAGSYGQAIPLLREAVARCGDSRDTACAYALYNLGRSLRLAGRPWEAIPVLERRLGYDDQTEVVQAELGAARRAAGQPAAPGAGGTGATSETGGKGPKPNHGKAKGHGKPAGDEKDD